MFCVEKIAETMPCQVGDKEPVNSGIPLIKWGRYFRRMCSCQPPATPLSRFHSHLNIRARFLLCVARQKKSARHRLAILSCLLCFDLIGPQWSRHSVARQKIRAASAGDFSLLRYLIRWSRHLVIYWRLLGNLIYWSCQRFAGKGLVVVREGISTPNAPYLR
jgi:hypothetical protein